MAIRDISGCGLLGFINQDGKRTSGEEIIRGIFNMCERGNGLGAGFAGYGIYPQHSDCFALHVMCYSALALEETRRIVQDTFLVREEGRIPTREVPEIQDPPLLYRFFVRAKSELVSGDRNEQSRVEVEEEDLVVRAVMHINSAVKGAYVFSSGRNMGAFKAVGEPHKVAEFYRIDEYSGYAWVAHTRFPTNTPGWWGGAHPFTVLDWAIVHNGEISSYGINRRYLEMWGYHCTLLTDTEVVAYALDLLIRKHKLPLRSALLALTSPFWKEIDNPDSSGLLLEETKALRAIRMVYGPLMLNGPFAIILGFNGGLVGLNDRIKLRPLVAGEAGETLYIASEEAAIHEVNPQVEQVWTPRAGEPVMGFLRPSSLPSPFERESEGKGWECGTLLTPHSSPFTPHSSLFTPQSVGCGEVSRDLVAADSPECCRQVLMEHKTVVNTPAVTASAETGSQMTTATRRGAGALGAVPTSSKLAKVKQVGVGDFELDADGVYYRFLNQQVRRLAKEGARRIVIRNVQGQRYIGTGIQRRSGELRIEVYGTAGNDLAQFMDGAQIEVFGNAEDGVGNTMNAGTVIVHGHAGDVIGYGMRGGRVFVRDDVGYRVGIHMKEYEEQVPIIIAGGTAGDFLGEYMAGGIIVVLGITGRKGRPITGDYVGTGMHGGRIYLRGDVDSFRCGKEVGFGEMGEEDYQLLHQHLTDFAQAFGMSVEKILQAPFAKLYPKSHRPYGRLYVSWWMAT